MKRVLFATIFSVAIFFILHTRIASAASCTNVNMIPGSGNVNQVFTLTAQCDPADSRYNVLTTYGPEQTVVPSMSGIVEVTGGELTFTIRPDASSQPGIYTAVVVYTASLEPVGQTSFEIKPTTDPTRKVCCSVNSSDANFCTSLEVLVATEPNCVVSANSLECPSLCQAVWAGSMSCGGPNSDLWFCAAARQGHASLCVDNGVTGIESAIGCIPIESVDQTTEFFIRWSLGVAGGLGLFLIASSAIKIMTTKGDPKRLQDARDTLSSAIAGLVLLVLSLYIVRFIAQELLNLF